MRNISIYFEQFPLEKILYQASDGNVWIEKNYEAAKYHCNKNNLELVEYSNPNIIDIEPIIDEPVIEIKPKKNKK